MTEEQLINALDELKASLYGLSGLQVSRARGLINWIKKDIEAKGCEVVTVTGSEQVWPPRGPSAKPVAAVRPPWQDGPVPRELPLWAGKAQVVSAQSKAKFAARKARKVQVRAQNQKGGNAPRKPLACDLRPSPEVIEADRITLAEMPKF